jgi:chaperonin cofactor prefoldin
MAGTSVLLVLFSLAVTSQCVSHDSRVGRGAAGAAEERSLLQTYNSQLNSNNAKDTPVTRVVNLLKNMQKTLEKEMEEDEGLWHEMGCWCNNNKYEKTQAIDAANEKISELEATIERLTARSKELKTKIAELEEEVAADKKALAEATAIREKQLKEFHAMEVDNIEALENLKAAIVVLGRHFGSNFPDTIPDFKTERDSWSGETQGTAPASFIQTKQMPWEENNKLSHSFEEFMLKSDFSANTIAKSAAGQRHEAAPAAPSLRAASFASTSSGWGMQEVDTVRKAMRSASAFMQATHGSKYYPSYTAQSGEIMGILKQLQEEMGGALLEAQKLEAKRAASFNELRKAKTAEIETGEKRAEQAEDEKAVTDNELAEAKEDLGVTQVQLEEDQKFLKNVIAKCDEGEAGFDKRKAARLSEIQAVADTINILTGDEARDAMETTFKGASFLQTSKKDKRRITAASILRTTALKTHNPELSMLATSVELDAFTKVKEMIDQMIATLKTQQEDEVKKNDWCKAELQENEMSILKTKDLKADLEAKIDQLKLRIKTLAEEIEQAHNDIAHLQTELQRASEDRKKENLDFQKVVADQMVTKEVLEKALDRLATYYDEAAFAQTQKKSKQPAQMTYEKSQGASGVMQMIEKLIYDTKDITAKSKTSEQEAQAAYEALIADTNASVLNLQKAITEKTKAKAKAKKDLAATEDDHADAVTELENLGKYNADLHAECDYLLQNFDIRQQARAEEIEALQQAKQILNGANLS